MLTTKFVIVLYVIMLVLTFGVIFNEVVMTKRLDTLEMRPVAVMPTKEIMTPTATPEATLVPTINKAFKLMPTKAK